MRFVFYQQRGQKGLAISTAAGLRGRLTVNAAFPSLALLLTGSPADRSAIAEALQDGEELDPNTIEFLPPVAAPRKIICVGLNYADHAAETGRPEITYPSVFSRFATSLTGHNTPIIRPVVSEQLDFEGELAAIIGRGGRNISQDQALEHIAGYSIFNDASVRDFQKRTTQWTMGKNFDETGAFGPEFVTADELPPGCKGLTLTTRLNGAVMQQASTDSMIFDVAALIALLSEVMTLESGDVIVSGTPAGVGMARTPPLWMKPGDVVEVEIEQLGALRNSVSDPG